MPAYNQRMIPNDLKGIPYGAAIGFIVMIAASTMTMLVQVLVIKIMTGLLAFFALLYVIFSFKLGENIVFFSVMWTSWWERRSKTAEMIVNNKE